MNRRRLVWLVPVVGASVAGLSLHRWLDAAPTPAVSPADPKPATTLPVTRVVLFSSGVGYFSRSGEIEGDARVDLTFPETDINDLIKSMTLEDLGGGRVASVSYESREPVGRTLSSFAINLNDNPSLTQILMQARGEKVEIALQPTAQAQPGTLSGTIVGLEKIKLPSGPNQQLEADVLTLLTADGLRSVKLMDVLRVKFQNPVLESELRRALDVLALSHDAQKKAVSLHFTGEGRRKVRVGYVVEAPIWKTSYRLVLDKEGKPYLQGWATVENVTDEDWHNVRMALVSGRPISFQMDLYNPLYVPRPMVEPELFASLRPPAYQGTFKQDQLAQQNRQQQEQLRDAAKAAPGGFGGRPNAPQAAAPADEANFHREKLRKSLANGEAEREQAAQLGQELSRRMDMNAVTSAATATKLGDSFQYLIGHPISLARQKSALLPVVSQDVEATRLSIYNPAVQPKHPLLGLRFKNTTGAHLSQGPITVFDGSAYAGDARILDVQPNEERLLAYAIDLGMEVKLEPGPGSTRITSIKAQKGIIHTTRVFREERVYKIANRADADRTLLIEHPNRSAQQFRLVETPKPVEETAELWRFQVAVPTGKTEVFKVVEERQVEESMLLSNSQDDQIRVFLSLNQASPELKAKLKEALTIKAKWDNARRELAQVQANLTRLTADQERIRKNLRETPEKAPVYETYLKKLSDQEKEIDALTARQKELMQAEFEAKKQYEDFLSTLSG